MAIQFLRPVEVMNATGLPKSSLYERAARGEFPRPLKMGARAAFWPAHEVEAWQRAVLAGASRERLRELVQALEAARKGEAA